ncbi:copper chaperone PCu(A)C [Candidatus Methylopumilus rimovensis]|jgi:copper(I)-binding protein|uniref:Copper chaperone PCu(A)C n=1 Tax=Candidatus Methylopumilus rimovensis TaxID=2588535 RepID=A0AAE6FU22_9PROT|nr:copper chaperone PCu(A)C [Candidatus Methylopumilus rimovensis]QDD13841.1 copper chaperone PCu(A)C [Candidatus Methylopumilus rimovensis]
MKFLKFTLFIIALLISTDILAARDIRIENAWIGSTDEGDDMSVAYMSLLSHEDLILTSVTSSRIKTIEMHNTIIEKGIMKMRMTNEIKIEHGKTFEFKSGGSHLMLMDFKGPLKAGQKVKLILHFKDKTNHSFDKSIDALIK